MRALIDAEIIATSISDCVVVPFTNLMDFTAGDVLAAVERCDRCNRGGRFGGKCWVCSSTGHIRRGFVRVVEVLPVVDADRRMEAGRCVTVKRLPSGNRDVRAAHGRWYFAAIDLAVSHGDVALVVEPWCETCGGEVLMAGQFGVDPLGVKRCPDCAPTPVRVVHRDGVIGTIESETL